MSATKEQIIEAALQLFGERGFEATTVRDIATLADVNVALINYHFTSKEGLLKELIASRAKSMQVRIKEISEDPSMSEMEKINEIIQHYIERMFTHHNFHKVFFLELFASNREPLHKGTIEIATGNIAYFTNIIQTGISKKIFREVDPELCFYSMIGPLHHIMHSSTMRTKLFSKKSNIDPITEPDFKLRVTRHIQQIMKDHLLAKK